MTVMPDRWCEIAFARDAGGFLLWRDVSDYVEWAQGVRISRRRSHELDEVQPGTLSLLLDNSDGRFTAGRTSSPYYPNVTLNRPLRIRARWPVSVNLATLDQATVTASTAFATAAGTVTRDTSVFPAGQTASIRWDGGVLGSTGQHMWAGSNSVTTATDQAVPVTEGVTYSLQMQARRGATAISITARIRWYDAAGAFLSVSAGSTVVLTTSFQTASVSAAAPVNAVFARLAIANATTTAGNAPVYCGAWQFERAASPTTYTAPGVEYRRFSGFVDRWPHAWTNGVLGVAAITATDRQKLLSRNKIRRAIVEQTLSTSPRAYYPLGEPAGSEQAGNIAVTAQPDMTVQTWNSGGLAEFGTSGGPDGTSGVQFTPTDINNGRFLLTSLTTPLGGGSGVSVAMWINFGATTQTAQNRLIFVDNGTDNVHLRINFNPFTNSLSLGARTSAGAVSGSATVNLDDLATHLVVATAQFSGGTMQLRAYVDGALVINTSPALAGSTWPSLPRVRVGGLPGTALDPPEMLMGMVSHVACWNSVLTLAQAQALSDAGAGFAGELSGARAARIAIWAGVTNTAFDTGSSLMDSNPSSEQTPLAAFKQVAFSEAGVFFVSGDDLVTIHGRNRRQLPSSVSISLSADQVGSDLQFTMDDQLLINDVSVSRSGKSVTRVVDQASIDQNEGSTYEKSIDTLLFSDTEALDRAAYTVATYGHPQPRAGVISVDAHSLGTVWAQMLGSEIGQRIQVTGLPSEAPASTVDLWCEGVADLIADGTWTFQFDTSPVRDTPTFILNDAALGTLDFNYLGW